MADKLEPGTPEFEEWVSKRAEERAKKLFSEEMPPELAELEKGLIAGPKDITDVMPEKSIPEDVAIEKSEKNSHLKLIK
ncbi:hypothetical protein [Psychromonas aquimarina]|uniref:hypothetical protein n=1 Tax=Psychromonas aquimarina TaxID=444919 RepID=UPI000415BC0B|nr:hypothetical protein [Psychromonas aquimarina]